MKTLVTTSFLLLSFFSFCQPIPKIKITAIEKIINTPGNQIWVISFWATFCKPCVAEIPSFIRITDKYQSSHVKLMLVSLDLPSYYPAKIIAFAKKHHFNTSITWLNETNADYFCPKVDAQWNGAIPATLIINTKTGY